MTQTLPAETQDRISRVLGITSAFYLEASRRYLEKIETDHKETLGMIGRGDHIGASRSYQESRTAYDITFCDRNERPEIRQRKSDLFKLLVGQSTVSSVTLDHPSASEVYCAENMFNLDLEDSALRDDSLQSIDYVVDNVMRMLPNLKPNGQHKLVFAVL